MNIETNTKPILKFAFIHANDLEQLHDFDKIARFVTAVHEVKKNLKDKYPEVEILTFLSGDIFFPSFLSFKYNGEPMMDILEVNLNFSLLFTI